MAAPRSLRFPYLPLRRAAALLAMTGWLTACGPAPAPMAPMAAATPPMARNTPAPDYPPELGCRQIGGQVILNVQLAPNGVPVRVDVFRTSGNATLDQLAVTAVKTWEFKGATAAGGKPVASKLQVPVNFRPPNPPPDECNRYL